MLTADLVLVRIRKKEVFPRFVDAEKEDNLGLAAQLIEAFDGAVGGRREDLDGELEDILGTGTAFQLHRGLAKLLRDQCRFETAAPVPPEDLRRAVFERSAAAWQDKAVFDRSATLEWVAADLGLEVDGVEQGLFADLVSQQMLTEARLPTPRALLDRYNVALAQGVLYRARELEIRVDGLGARDYEALFRQIKFHQLMHSIFPDGSGWRILLDGPTSILRSSGRYGLQMAQFLPTLLHFGGWTLEARLAWGKRRLRKVMNLSAADGLRPHTKLGGRWLPEEVAAVPERINALDSGWTARPGTTLINLGGEAVLVPDLELRHDDGRRAYVEIFGFWNKGAVKRRMQAIKKHAPPGVVVAVLGSLGAGAAEDLDRLPASVVVFKRTLLPKKLLSAVEAVAVSRSEALDADGAGQ